jgi:hypothetical protein
MQTSADRETTVATVWPTIGATRCGRCVGRLAGLQPPGDRLRLVGKAMAVGTIPVSLAVFFWQLLPFVARRYRMTDRRIVIQKGLSAVEERSIGLDQFDAVDVEFLPGQEWLRTGEIVFRRAGQEVFRLSGVPCPEPFRRLCQEVQSALAAGH